MMDSKELTKIAVKALEDKKGEDIKVIDIHEVSVLADYFIIADGNNRNQVQAMIDNVEEILSAGANIIVAGSAVFNGDIAENTECFLQKINAK